MLHRHSWLTLLMTLPLFLAITSVHAAPPSDPPLTYRLIVYDRDPGKLAPDGTKVIVLGLPPRHAPCAEAEVRSGVAELRVDVTPNCPAGMYMHILLMGLPGGGTLAVSEPDIGFDWRAAAYSESTSNVTATLRPMASPPGSSDFL